MKFKNIILSILFLSIIVIIGCTKTVPKTPLEFQKELLAGTSAYLNTQRTWQLDSFFVDGANASLTALQKEYDGLYSDYPDKNIGTWEISTLGKLKETITYTTNNKKDSSVYEIVSINAARLKLTIKLSNGKLGSYSFKISN